MVDDRIKLESSWKNRIGDYLMCEEMTALGAFLRQRKAQGARIYPPGAQIFSAFDATPFDAVNQVATFGGPADVQLVAAWRPHRSGGGRSP